MKTKILNIYIFFCCFLLATTIDVSTIEELDKALERAKPGQIISIAPGVYDCATYERKYRFELYASGTSASPITLTAQNPVDPPILRGSSLKIGSIIQITGSYWIIENIKITYGGSAIVLENTNYNIIRNVEIYGLGSEGIRTTGGSSHNLFQNCYIHSTGNFDEGYGIGFDIGNPLDKIYDNYKSDYNVIEGCIFKNVASEHIRIRVNSTWNEVRKCVFYGEGINGKNDADSFVSISGSDNYFHNNVGFRNENKNIMSAFEVEKLVEESGDGNIFENNVLYMDSPYGEIDTEKRIYVVDGAGAKFSVKLNKVNYGYGLVDADSEEFYNSDFVTYLK